MRVLAHRPTSRRCHARVTPHFTLPIAIGDEVNTRGFSHFLRSRMNLSPTHDHQTQQLPSRTYDHAFFRPIAAPMSEHSLRLDMPHQRPFKCEHCSEGLTQSHFGSASDHAWCTPGHRFDTDLASRNEALHNSSSHSYAEESSATTLADQEYVSSSPCRSSFSHAADNSHLYTTTDVPMHACPLISLPPTLSAWRPESAQQVLPSHSDGGTPATSWQEKRVTTQENIWKYQPVADAQWASAGLDYEAQFASSPESIDDSVSETASLTASACDSPNNQSFRTSNILAGRSWLNSCAENSYGQLMPHDRHQSIWHSVEDGSGSPILGVRTFDDDDFATFQQLRHPRSTPTQGSYHPLRMVFQDQSAAAETQTKEDRSRLDQQLLAWRKEGLSYKQIKLQGRFSEAESTLRGRYRALTKASKDRVRKPCWTARDVSRCTSSLSAIY